jgi:hypothetical protein
MKLTKKKFEKKIITKIPQKKKRKRKKKKKKRRKHCGLSMSVG